MQAWYSGDDLQYAMVIERAVTGKVFYHPEGGQSYQPESRDQVASSPERLPVNPRYLFEWPTSVVFAQLWQLLGWKENVIVPILVLRALVGAMGVLFFVLACYKLSGDKWIAIINSAGFATSAAYWTYSTHLDQSINMIALICLAFFILVWFRNSSRQNLYRVLIAITLALAALYNLTAMLTIFVFSLTIMFSVTGEVRSRISRLVQFSATFAIPIGIVMVLGFVLLVSPADLTNPDYWKSFSFQGHPEYLIDPLRDAQRAILGFAKSQINYPWAVGSLQRYWDNATTNARLMLLGFYGAILAFMAVPIIALARMRISFLPSRGWVWQLLAQWIVHFVFIWLWDPGYIKYWIIPLLAWWGIVAIVLGHLKCVALPYYRLGIIAVTLFVLLSVSINLTTQFLPQSNARSNVWLSIAESLKHTQPSALFISPGHPLDFYIAYFTGRDIVSTGLLDYGSGGNNVEIKRVVSAHIEQHQHVGGKVFVYGIDSMSEQERRRFFDLISVQQVKPAMSFSQVIIYEADFGLIK